MVDFAALVASRTSGRPFPFLFPRRRTRSLELYASSDPEWEVVLDFDALGTAEGESWVYKGYTVYDLDDVSN